MAHNEKTSDESATLTLTLTSGTMAYVRALHRTGLWGLAVEDVAERLICAQIQRLIDQRRLNRTETSNAT